MYDSISANAADGYGYGSEGIGYGYEGSVSGGDPGLQMQPGGGGGTQMQPDPILMGGGGMRPGEGVPGPRHGGVAGGGGMGQGGIKPMLSQLFGMQQPGMRPMPRPGMRPQPRRMQPDPRLAGPRSIAPGPRPMPRPVPMPVAGGGTVRGGGGAPVSTPGQRGRVSGGNPRQGRV